MKKLIIICFAAALTAACAAKPVTKPVSGILSEAVTKQEPETIVSNEPESFEKQIPTSSIMLQSLVIFDKTYARAYSDNSVTDAAAGTSLAAVLKDGELGFTMPACPALSLSDNFNRVQLSGYNVIIYNQTKIEIYSAYDCVRFSALKRTLRGEVRLLGDKVLEWEGSKVTLRTGAGNLLYEGDIGRQVATGGLIGGKVVLIQSDGFIMGYNDSIRAFALDGTFPLKFSILNFAGGMFYGTTAQDGYFFTLGDKSGETYEYKECTLSINSPYALCGGTLLGADTRYSGVPAETRFSAGSGLLLDMKDGNLNIFNLASSWQRFVSFGYTLPAPCLGDDGTVYYDSFTGISYAMQNGVERPSPRPQKCDPAEVELKGGVFLCKGTECGIFAETVNTDGKTRMLRRIENGKWHYYFE